jgi:tetratricopeptide (TPR) repeat protein
MTPRFLLIVPLLLVLGCQSDRPDSRAIPADAKFTEAKEPPITADTRYAAGLLAESGGAPSKAIVQYSEAVKLDPKHQASLYRLGIVHAQLKDFPAAIEAWQQYIIATDYAAPAYGNLGFCYELAGDAEKAEQSYKKGIERSPKDQLCRVNYGLMLARMGKANDALVQLKAVLKPAEAHYNLGSIYEQQGKTAQAKLEYTRALEADPTFFDAQQRLAAME